VVKGIHREGPPVIYKKSGGGKGSDASLVHKEGGYPNKPLPTQPESGWVQRRCPQAGGGAFPHGTSIRGRGGDHQEGSPPGRVIAKALPKAQGYGGENIGKRTMGGIGGAKKRDGRAGRGSRIG